MHFKKFTLFSQISIKFATIFRFVMLSRLQSDIACILYSVATEQRP